MNLAWYASIALHVVLLGQLARLHLVRHYPALSICLLFGIVRSLVLASIPLFSYAYFWTWTISEPIIWATDAAVAIEVFRLLCSHYRGIERVSKGLFVVTMAVSAIAAAGPLFFETQYFNSTGLVLLKTLMFVAARFIFTALALFTAGAIAFTLVHPESIRKNVRLYAVLTSVYFAADAAHVLAATVSQSVFGANAVLIPLYAAIGLVWILFLRRAGEHVEQRLPSGNREAIGKFHHELVDTVSKIRIRP